MLQKSFLFTALTFILNFTLSAIAKHSPSKIVLSFHKNEAGKLSAAIRQYTVTQNAKGMFCKTNHVPNHRVQVRGLNSLELPIKIEKPHSHCHTILRWGAKHQVCYEHGKYPIIDDLIRWCSSF